MIRFLIPVFPILINFSFLGFLFLYLTDIFLESAALPVIPLQSLRLQLIGCDNLPFILLNNLILFLYA